MRVVVESRTASPATIEKRWPGAAVLEVTSKGPDSWVRFRPF